MISGKTTLIAHIGYPTFAFKSPMIYNPWFEKNNIDAVVVPLGVKPEEYREFFPLLFKMTNIRGALVTMRGEVVGIVTAILNPTNQRFFVGIGFAVPIENAAAAVGVPPF